MDLSFAALPPDSHSFLRSRRNLSPTGRPANQPVTSSIQLLVNFQLSPLIVIIALLSIQIIPPPSTPPPPEKLHHYCFIHSLSSSFCTLGMLTKHGGEVDFPSSFFLPPSSFSSSAPFSLYFAFQIVFMLWTIYSKTTFFIYPVCVIQLKVSSATFSLHQQGVCKRYTCMHIAVLKNREMEGDSSFCHNSATFRKTKLYWRHKQAIYSHTYTFPPLHTGGQFFNTFFTLYSNFPSHP